jgi:hypothetical protein
MAGIAHSSWTHVLLVHDIDAGQNLTIDDDDALYQNADYYRARHVYVSTLHQTLLSRIKQLKLIRSETGHRFRDHIPCDLRVACNVTHPCDPLRSPPDPMRRRRGRRRAPSVIQSPRANAPAAMDVISIPMDVISIPMDALSLVPFPPLPTKLSAGHQHDQRIVI